MIPLADLKAWLGVTDTSSDGDLAALEARQVAVVSKSLDRYFGEPAATEEIFGGGVRVLWLAEAPIADTLSVYTRASMAAAWELVDPADFEIDGRQLIKVEGLWPVGFRTVKTPYQRGYAEGAGPGDVEQVVLELCARAWEGRGNSATQREKLGPLEIEYRPLRDVPDPIDSLSAWRRVWVA